MPSILASASDMSAESPSPVPVSAGNWNLIEPSDRVVVVLGAGATVSEMLHPTPPSVPPPCDGNFLQIAEACCPGQAKALRSAFDRLWQDGAAYPIHHQRMEQLFAGTFLRVAQTRGTTTDGRAARELYDELVLLLRDTLYETTQKAAPAQHLELFRKIVACQPASLDFVTFNYDCLADRALRQGNSQRLWSWSHQDGYGFVPSNQHAATTKSSSLILKLHGSMNWYIPLPGKKRRTAYDPSAAIYVPNPPTRLDAPAWHRRQRVLGHKKNRRVFPLMIPPIFDKATSISGKLGEVWETAQSKLDNATIVIVWGYSLPATDYHAEMLFAQGARRSHSRLIVVNPDKAALGRVTEVCGHRWTRWFFRIQHLFDALNAQAQEAKTQPFGKTT